ncbi:helix-loop-helix protein delilah [Sitodiplosis mosellana]|uniref:helix-loop-helix protein delilah n=1 Tax=Sitodiplosis mosellana TaxID=263140 RepID=UPI0024439C92|nr:helix-loop-helix protein delilah [Sitodiplosis mosellana]
MINSYKYHQYQFHHHPQHSIVHHTKTNTTMGKMKHNSKSQAISVTEIADQPNEKYSLRQRQKRSTRNTNKQTENSTKTTEQSNAADQSMDPATATPQTSTQQTKSNNKKSAAKAKSKQKAAPLSKYRRKTANARERIRMREINSAFEHLRQCVPVSFGDNNPTQCNEKLTKITTLRMAMKYISTLNDILNSSETDCDTTLLNNIINKSTMQPAPTSSTYMNNNNDSMAINNNTADVETKTVSGKSKRKSKKSTATTTTKANKTISKRKTTKTKATTKAASKMTQKNSAKKAQMYEPMPNNISTLCLTPPSSATDSPIDLGLMLESDGESLHLSEPCLSPPLSSTQSTKPFISTMLSPPPSMTMSSGLDIGLFLDSDTDSLHFPEPCLSPLDGGFDAFSPFGDLLNPGFPEHSSLDIYLT